MNQECPTNVLPKCPAKCPACPAKCPAKCPAFYFGRTFWQDMQDNGNSAPTTTAAWRRKGQTVTHNTSQTSHPKAKWLIKAASQKMQARNKAEGPTAMPRNNLNPGLQVSIAIKKLCKDSSSCTSPGQKVAATMQRGNYKKRNK